MTAADSDRLICELCRKEFQTIILEEVMPRRLAGQADHTICPACQIIYNYEPTGCSCFTCGTAIEQPTKDGYQFDIEFPVTAQSDSPLVKNSGALCSNCASQIGLDMLFRGIRSRSAAHERLVEALEQQNNLPPTCAQGVGEEVQTTDDEFLEPTND